MSKLSKRVSCSCSYGLHLTPYPAAVLGLQISRWPQQRARPSWYLLLCPRWDALTSDLRSPAFWLCVATLLGQVMWGWTWAGWRREWQPTSVFLPGEFHGQKSLVGYSLRGCKELDTTERLTHTHTHTHTHGPLGGYPDRDGPPCLCKGHEHLTVKDTLL